MSLRVARIKKNMTQLDLGILVGVSQQTIAKWERGVSTPSHLSIIRKIEHYLDEPAGELFPDVFA